MTRETMKDDDDLTATKTLPDSNQSRLESASSRFRQYIKELRDRTGKKYFPKAVSVAQKFRIGSETGKLVLIVAGAVIFVVAIWWMFDRRTPSEDIDEITRPLAQAPEVSESKA
jgi:hypothetical protein